MGPVFCGKVHSLMQVDVRGVYLTIPVQPRDTYPLPAPLSFHHLLIMASAELTPEQISYQLAHAPETKQPIIWRMSAVCCC
jgi:hypothetical protein